MHAASDRSGSSSGEEELLCEDYAQAVRYNLAAVGITFLLSLFLLVWYVISIMFYVNWLDRVGILLLPIFSMCCWLLIPGAGWMWITFYRAGFRRRRILLPLVLSLIESVYGSCALYITGIVLYQVIWGLLT